MEILKAIKLQQLEKDNKQRRKPNGRAMKTLRRRELKNWQSRNMRGNMPKSLNCKKQHQQLKEQETRRNKQLIYLEDTRQTSPL